MTPRTAHASLDRYKTRGLECGFANSKLIGRVIGSLYDSAFQPVGLRASQVAALWGVLALEPVELGKLADGLVVDQTTASRTVAGLARLGYLDVGTAANDARVRTIALTDAGRAKLDAAMPLWETAQAELAALIDLDLLRRLARTARRTHATKRAA